MYPLGFLEVEHAGLQLYLLTTFLKSESIKYSTPVFNAAFAQNEESRPHSMAWELFMSTLLVLHVSSEATFKHIQ